MNASTTWAACDGFGKVEPEPNEPVFHAAWEGRVFALQLAMGYAGGLEHRHVALCAREPPIRPNILSMSPITRSGSRPEAHADRARRLSAADEIAAGHALHPAKPRQAQADAGRRGAGLQARLVRARDRHEPAFKPGDKVRAKNINPRTHTRLPRYVRGHVGEIVRVIGCHVFPDSNAHGLGEDPQWLYTVRFDGRELWGPDGDPSVKVSVDAWEPYLEKA